MRSFAFLLAFCLLLAVALAKDGCHMDPDCRRQHREQQGRQLKGDFCRPGGKNTCGAKKFCCGRDKNRGYCERETERKKLKCIL
ncbi:unnamed protein product, partial [Mesorhabditis spiculigera]